MLKKMELLLLILLITSLVILNKNIGKFVISEEVEIVDKIVVLDAGHGGKDPGKVGINGVLEKDINLQITKKIKKLLEAKGISVVMTRETDQMLCEDESNNKKQEDMRARVELINEINPYLTVSIHQNSYTDSSVSGAQVFYYSESDEGERMAVIMQKALLEADMNNTREAKANDSYYLLKRTQVPTIIVECGFLSNQEEAGKLAMSEYQDEIAKAIVNGIESCFEN